MEHVHYESKIIRITNKAITFAGKNHELSDITGASMRQAAKNNEFTTILIFIFATLTSFSTIPAFMATNFLAGVVCSLMGMVPFGTAALVSLYFSKKSKPTYIVMLNRINGDLDTIKSKDRDKLQFIVNTINEAIAAERSTQLAHQGTL